MGDPTMKTMGLNGRFTGHWANQAKQYWGWSWPVHFHSDVAMMFGFLLLDGWPWINHTWAATMMTMDWRQNGKRKQWKSTGYHSRSSLHPSHWLWDVGFSLRWKTYNFFVPDREYCTNLEGLLEHLWMKPLVAKGRGGWWCDGWNRGFWCGISSFKTSAVVSHESYGTCQNAVYVSASNS